MSPPVSSRHRGVSTRPYKYRSADTTCMSFRAAGGILPWWATAVVGHCRGGPTAVVGHCQGGPLPWWWTTAASGAPLVLVLVAFRLLAAQFYIYECAAPSPCCNT